MASTRLTRTTGAGNRQKWTWSGWIKRNNISYGDAYLMGVYVHGADHFRFYFPSTDQLHVKFYNNTSYELLTNRRFRDTNAWYHIVLRVDNTQSTASNRFRLYINGEQETSFATENQPTQNLNMSVNDSNVMEIGSYNNGGFWDGCMSHVNFCDSYSYDASYFGETDSTTGIWKPKTAPSVTYGTNGYFLKFENSASMGTDSSSQSNNFTVNGTMTQLIDTPSNVFCTANPLSLGTSTVLSNGNTTARNDTSSNSTTLGTIGFGNGKYYWEGYRHGGGNIGIGVCNANVSGSDNNSVTAGRVLYYENGTIFCEGLSDQSNITTGVTYADTDIISVSMDTENGILKFYKNDTLVTNSTITNSKFTNAENIWLPHTYQNNGGEWRLNFGNGYFGTTVISSQGTNASNNGKFEYDVKPSDATALSTKGLNL